VITVAQALAILDGAVGANETESVALSEALGRVLAREVESDTDWPPFDTSAMDGYALSAGDLTADLRLAERPGLVAAGDPPPAPLNSGEAVRVMTGAPLPEGADAVVPLESSRRERGGVAFDRAPEPGAHLRRRGESVARGARLLDRGRRLSAADVALAALAGADPIDAIRRPRVSIAVTGNEIVPPSAEPRAGQLRDSNGPMLFALCRARGAPAVSLDRVADEPKAVERLFLDSRQDGDVLVTSGGVSAGDLDLLPGAALRAGWEILFHKVSVRPGRPIAFARRGRSFWFGLPGNPVSASVTFHLFVAYALDRLEGAARPGPRLVTARLAREIESRGPRETYRDGLLSSEGGQLSVEPLRSAGSHDIAAHARADALIRLEPETGRLPAGSEVLCVLLER